MPGLSGWGTGLREWGTMKRIAGTLIPAATTDDIGTSTTKWHEGHFSGAVAAASFSGTLPGQAGVDTTAIHNNVAGEIAALASVAAAAADHVVVEDADDTNKKKRVTAQSIADLAGGGGWDDALADTPTTGGNNPQISYGDLLQFLATNYGDWHIEIAEVQTTDDTITTIWSQTLADPSVLSALAIVTGVTTDRGKRTLQGRICYGYRSGAAAVEDHDGSLFTAYESDASWSVDWDVSGNNIVLEVQADIGDTVEWSAFVIWYYEAM